MVVCAVSVSTMHPFKYASNCANSFKLGKCVYLQLWAIGIPHLHASLAIRLLLTYGVSTIQNALIMRLDKGRSLSFHSAAERCLASVFKDFKPDQYTKNNAS